MSSSFRMRVQQHQQIQVQLQKKPQKTKLRICLQVRESTPVPFNYDYITFDTMHITGFLIKCLEDRKLSESEHLEVATEVVQNTLMQAGAHLSEEILNPFKGLENVYQITKYMEENLEYSVS